MVSIVKLENGRYTKPCPQCNEQQTYLRRNYAEESLRLGKLCKSCANKITENCHRKFYEGIRISWVEKCKAGAEYRGIQWDLSVEYIWQLYLAQDKRCALSGKYIGWAKEGQIHTASIDRVDSTEGYIMGNIQIVHKDINFMKQQYSQEYFAEMCKLVAGKVKWWGTIWSKVKGGLGKWFGEKWVDVKTGKNCGRSGEEKNSRGYLARRPKTVAKKVSASEKQTMASKKTGPERKSWPVSPSGKRKDK